ncbi:MAG: hypothetical protein ACFB9M_11470 [Myxococcota bacterium]
MPSDTSEPQRASEDRSLWPVVALALAVVLVVPLAPLLGAAMGLGIWLSGAKGKDKTMAIAALAIGGIGGTASLLAFLTVVAPGTLNLGSRAREKDAAFNLRAVERQLYRHVTTRGGYPVGDTGWTPPRACCAGSSQVCPRNEADWAHPVWRSLDFAPLSDSIYQLRYQSLSPEAFTVWARGDPECDGTVTLIEMRGGVTMTGGPTTEPWERREE